MTQQEKTGMPAGQKTLTWADCPGVQRHPGRLAGAWTIEHTRMPIHIIFGNLATGATITEVTEWYEGVTEDQVKTLLDHAAKMLEQDRLTTPEQP